MTQDFSDAPLIIDGITIKPKFRWSKQYRADVAEGMRATGQTDISESERESLYIKWYAEKHELTRDEARRRVKAMR